MPVLLTEGFFWLQGVALHRNHGPEPDAEHHARSRLQQRPQPRRDGAQEGAEDLRLRQKRGGT